VVKLEKSEIESKEGEINFSILRWLALVLSINGSLWKHFIHAGRSIHGCDETLIYALEYSHDFWFLRFIYQLYLFILEQLI
jgi:hypothetical protein